MSGHTLDARSLTLPDWRHGLKRVRRWRPPRPRCWFALLQFAANLAGLAVSVFTADPVGTAWFTVNCLGWWRWAWKGLPSFLLWLDPEGQPRYPLLLDWLFFAWLMLQVVLIAVSFIS